MKNIVMTAAFLAASFAGAQTATADGADPYLGEVVLTGANFCPKGYALADGTLMPISGNSALFAVLGNRYGGDARTTFALPNLNGRAIAHAGTGPGLTTRELGVAFGSETTTLTINHMPSHSHTVNTTSAVRDATSFAGNSIANFPAGFPAYAAGSPDVTMNEGVIGTTGKSAPIDNAQPSAAMFWCIAVQGEFPPRG